MTSPRPGRLRDLRLRMEPPPELEERIVQTLRNEGLIRHTSTGGEQMKKHYAVMSIVAVAALLAGFVAGQRLDDSPAAAADDDLEQFVMLLYENDSYQYPEEGRMAERIGEYSQWAREVAAAGKLVAGEKLADDGLLVAPGQSPTPTIPVAEQGTIGGYFIIRAQDADEAAALAATCPHVRYGGTVSLRRLH